MSKLLSDSLLKEVNNTSQLSIRQTDYDRDLQDLFSLLNNYHIIQSEYEKDMAKLIAEIHQLDKGGMKFLTPEDVQKKYFLQNLLSQRQATHGKEQQYLKNLQNYKEQYILNEKLMNTKGTSILDTNNKREQILKLKLQWEQILTEKAKIQRDQNNPNTFTSAGLQVLMDINKQYNWDAAKQKLHKDQARIQLLRAKQADELLHKDLDEVLNSGPGDNTQNEARYLLKQSIGKTTREQLENLTKIREQLEEYNKGNSKLILPFEIINNEKQQTNSTQVQLKEIDQLRVDYVKAGGIDPNFLLNLQNLEKVLNSKYQQQPLSNPNIQKPQYVQIQGKNQVTSSMPNLSQYQGYNPIPQQQQQIYNNNFPSQQGYQQQGHNQLTPSILTTHPVYQYLPQTFKEELMNLANQVNPIPVEQNKSKIDPNNADDMTLEYLRNQEAELLLTMSRFDPRSPDHQRLMENFKQLQKLRNLIEKAIFDKKVSEAITKDKEYRKKLIKQQVNLFDRSSRAVHYAASEGFVLFFDYASMIEIQYHTLRINYGIFRKGSDMYPYKQTKDSQVAFETYRTNKCVFFDRDLIRDLEAYPDTYIFIELWGYQSNKPDVIGWSMIKLFQEENKLLVGRFRIPFYSQKLNPNFLFTQALPYVNNTLIYGRICLPNDPILDSSDIIVIESEYDMPEMHIHTTAHAASLAEIQDVYLNDFKKNEKKTPLPSVDLGTTQNQSFKQITNQSSESPQTNKGGLSGTSKKQRFSNRGSKLNSKATTPTPSSKPKSQYSDSTKLIFRLIKLSKLPNNELNSTPLKLKLGIFNGSKILEDFQQQPQMAVLQLESSKTGDKEMEFQIKHEFSLSLDWLNNYRGDDVMLFMGIFVNQKDLFGWLATPLFYHDQLDDEFKLKVGAYSSNLLAPPGQSPPFNPETMKKQESEIDFIIMTSDQRANQLQLYDTYSSLHNSKLDQSKISNLNKTNRSSIVPSIFNKSSQSLNKSQGQVQIEQTITIILEQITGLINDDEYALRIAIVCQEKLLHNLEDKPCALTTNGYNSQKGSINFNQEIIEFEVDFNSEKNQGINKLACQLLIYITQRRDIVAWFTHDIVKYGRYSLPLHNLPIQKPPIDKTKIQKHPIMTIAFEIKQLK